MMTAIDEMSFCVKEGKSARLGWRCSVKWLSFYIKCFFNNHLHFYRNGEVMGFWRIIFTIILPRWAYSLVKALAGLSFST
jgi:hypothetical protein